MIDPASLGYSITVFAMVSLKSQAEADLKAFEDHVAQLPEVRECHMLNGEIDFILKVVAKDLQSFQQFLTSQLTPAPMWPASRHPSPFARQGICPAFRCGSKRGFHHSQSGAA